MGRQDPKKSEWLVGCSSCSCKAGWFKVAIHAPKFHLCQVSASWQALKASSAAVTCHEKLVKKPWNSVGFNPWQFLGCFHRLSHPFPTKLCFRSQQIIQWWPYFDIFTDLLNHAGGHLLCGDTSSSSCTKEGWLGSRPNGLWSLKAQELMSEITTKRSFPVTLLQLILGKSNNIHNIQNMNIHNIPCNSRLDIFRI